MDVTKVDFVTSVVSGFARTPADLRQLFDTASQLLRNCSAVLGGSVIGSGGDSRPFVFNGLFNFSGVCHVSHLKSRHGCHVRHDNFTSKIIVPNELLSIEQDAPQHFLSRSRQSKVVSSIVCGVHLPRQPPETNSRALIVGPPERLIQE